MDAQSMGMLAVLGGGFGIGLWYIMVRSDANLAMTVSYTHLTLPTKA